MRRPMRSNTKKDRVKKLVDGKPPGRLELIAKNYIGPIGTIARTVAGIASAINVEDKLINVTSTATVGSSGSIALLTGLAQGLGDNDRVGNKLLLQSIYFNLIASQNPIATTTFLRVILFVDKECDGAAPAVADVIGPTPSVVNPINEDLSKRFVILKNKVFNMNLNGTMTGKLKVFQKLPFHTFYDGATSGLSDLKENQLFLLLISDQATNSPSVSYYSIVNACEVAVQPNK